MFNFLRIIKNKTQLLQNIPIRQFTNQNYINQKMNSINQMIKLGQSQVDVSLIKGDNISEEIFTKVQQCKKFNDWVSQFDTTNINVKQVKVDYVFMFGPHVGFVNLIVDATTQSHNIRLPGFVFLRGKAVAMLVIVNRKYMLLTKQFRVPAGQWLLEAPAGMIDESGHFSGVAAKELQEETGIDIELKELIELGGMYTTPGGCDEETIMYAIEKELSEEKIKEITSKIHGEHDEQISLELREFNIEEVVRTKDSKLMCATLAYQAYKNKQNQQSKL